MQKKIPNRVELPAPVPHERPRYTLEGLLAQGNPEAPLTLEEREWIDAKPVGREL